MTAMRQKLVHQGEVKPKSSRYQYPNFGINAPPANGYLLQRLQLNGDLHVTDYFRAFVQSGDDRIFGNRWVPLDHR